MYDIGILVWPPRVKQFNEHITITKAVPSWNEYLLFKNLERYQVIYIISNLIHEFKI